MTCADSAPRCGAHRAVLPGDGPIDPPACRARAAVPASQRQPIRLVVQQHVVPAQRAAQPAGRRCDQMAGIDEACAELANASARLDTMRRVDQVHAICTSNGLARLNTGVKHHTPKAIRTGTDLAKTVAASTPGGHHATHPNRRRSRMAAMALVATAFLTSAGCRTAHEFTAGMASAGSISGRGRCC
jgi:hypothetical protein